jgi:hypothetical protein
MKKLAVLVASMAVSVGALFGVATVVAKEAPAAVETVKAPITTADTCMCGGPVLIWWQNLGNGTCLYVYRRSDSPYLDNVIRPC